MNEMIEIYEVYLLYYAINKLHIFTDAPFFYN